MKQKAIVLGCGLVGATMARDLAADDGFDVTVADVSERNLGKLAGAPQIKTTRADLGSADAIRKAVEPFDIVIGALPSRFGFMALRTIIECGKPYADISFMIEDATELDALAKEKGVTVVVDCGVAPGLANMIIGHCHARLDETDDVVFYVGGLPKERTWPFQYKAPFAPSDVVEEYTRPARMIENGRVVVKPALSEPELIDFPHVGTLEAFNTDGLRSLLTTIKATNIREKTLRYPGHIELMRVFRETGLFGKDPIEVGGVKVRPLDVTSKLMFPMWELTAQTEEFTVLRVVVEGRQGGKPQRFSYDLYDETDLENGNSSMARTTGFPCVIAARMIAEGRFTKRGVFPPELLGMEPNLLDEMTDALKQRGVEIVRSE